MSAAWAPLLALAFAAGAPEVPEVEGSWVRVEEAATLARLPAPLGAITSTTRAVLLLQVKQSGAELDVASEVCELETHAAGGMVRSEYPAAFLTALARPHRRARLEVRGGRLVYFEPPELTFRGVSSEVARGPLPGRAEDERVVDADHDGHPGLTVHIAGIVRGEIYVIQRATSSALGAFRAPDELGGGLRWTMDQVVLGASVTMLASTPQIVPHPDRRRSWFEMRRVAAKSTCADVLERARHMNSRAGPADIPSPDDSMP